MRSRVCDGTRTMSWCVLVQMPRQRLSGSIWQKSASRSLLSVFGIECTWREEKGFYAFSKKQEEKKINIEWIFYPYIDPIRLSIHLLFQSRSLSVSFSLLSLPLANEWEEEQWWGRDERLSVTTPFFDFLFNLFLFLDHIRRWPLSATIIIIIIIILLTRFFFQWILFRCPMHSIECRFMLPLSRKCRSQIVRMTFETHMFSIITSYIILCCTKKKWKNRIALVS